MKLRTFTRRAFNWLFPLKEDEPDKPPRIHPWRWRALTLWVILFTSIAFYGMRTNRELTRDGRQAHDAICVLKRDLARRIVEQSAILDVFPGGVPGVSRSGVDGMKSTFRALGAVRCDPPIVIDTTG